ncbi:MAG: hypothetical protein HY344_00865 [Candidatus Levybacteria bacterium]|nr:hypothetical protein [Candidatus Levybacteria bacterium]
MALSLSERNLLRRGIRPDRKKGAVSLGQRPSAFGVNRGSDRPLSAEQFAVKDILSEALRAQADLIASGRYDGLVGKSGEGFFDAFVEDPLFDTVYELAKQEVSEVKDFMHYGKLMRGAMGAAMGFLHLSALSRITPERSVPLSGEDAFKIAQALSPDAETIIDPFGNKGLKRRYVPDGYGINKIGKVAEVIEYSSGPKGLQGLQQEDSFWMMVDELGSLAYTPTFLHVSPLGVNVPGSVERMPFNVRQYYRFYDYVYSTYKASSGAPTLLELRTQWEQSSVGRQVALGEPSQAIFPQARS